MVKSKKIEFEVIDQGFEDAETIETTYMMNAVAKVRFEGRTYSVPYRYTESTFELTNDSTREIDEVLYDEIECDNPSDDDDLENAHLASLVDLLGNLKKHAEDLLWK